MCELKNKAKAQGLEIKYDWRSFDVEAINKLKEYVKAGNINFKEKFIKPWEDEENTVSRKGILA